MDNPISNTIKMHVTGQSVFIDDKPVTQNTLFGYVFTSSIAKGKITSFNTSEAKQCPGVVCILSHDSIPGKNQMGTLRDDEPILTSKKIEFYGQAIFIIAAISEEVAIEAAKKIELNIEEETPVVNLDEAIKLNHKHMPTITMKRGNLEQGFEEADHIIENKILSGAQEHWYLETQIAYATPQENNNIKVYSSTQHPSETQTLIAQALNINRNKVEVETQRIGGGFGGKETQANGVAIWASLLAVHTKQPVKLKLDRITDQSITGKRNPFLSQYKIGFTNQGIITAYKVAFHVNAGYSLDLTMPILARARTHAENAYFIPHIKIESTCYKTNLPSNTAFRGFGAPQGIYAIEYAIEQIAQKLKKDPAQIRLINFYQNTKNNSTPYGQLVAGNQLNRIYNRLTALANYTELKQQVALFNKNNNSKKQGLALIPVKFGISFNTPFLNQAGSFVNIYTDGSIQISQSGIEMGQGLNTKIKQIAAHEFGIPLSMIELSATNTWKIPNTSATAASTGSDLNGMAVKNATDQLKKRLVEYLCQKWNIKLSDENIKQFKFINQQIAHSESNNAIAFKTAVKQAYLSRISLSAQGFYATPNLHFNKETQTGQPYFYFAYGASVSRIELDLQTGNHEVLSTHIVHDSGKSINKQIDIGQIEGAFIQGVGWCTTEEIKWDSKGKILNNSPENYKIPGIRDIPKLLKIELLNENASVNTIMKSKAVGEPPFIHGLSVFFAINNALQSVNNDFTDIKLYIPATNEKIVKLIAQIKK